MHARGADYPISFWPNSCQGSRNCNRCNVRWLFSFTEVCILVGTFLLHKYIDVTANQVLLSWQNKQLRAHSMYLVATIKEKTSRQSILF